MGEYINFIASTPIFSLMADECVDIANTEELYPFIAIG